MSRIVAIDPGGNTRPSSQSLSYVSVPNADADAFGASVGAGLKDMAGAILSASADLQERKEKADRYKTLFDFTQFQTGVQKKLTELKRDFDPIHGDFVGEVDKVYAEMQAKFLQGVPGHLQDEFKLRTMQIQQGVFDDVFQFELDVQDDYFRTTYKDRLDQARLGLNQSESPREDIAKWKSQLDEMLASGTISAVEKREIERATVVALESAAYKSAYRQGIVDDAALGLAATGGDVRGLIVGKEGFRSKAYPDYTIRNGQRVNSGWRVGYGSDTYVDEQGRVRRVTPSTVITRAQADADLDRRIKEFQNIAVQAVGMENWARLPEAAKAALTSTTYNYGRLPSAVAAAVKGGDLEAIARAVEGLKGHNEGINANRRQEEANLIRGTARLSKFETDPAFQNIPFDERVKLQEDAQREAAGQIVQIKKEEKDYYDSVLNDLETRIIDKQAGRTDIDAFRRVMQEQGVTVQAADLKRLNNYLKDQEKEQALTIQAQRNDENNIWADTKENRDALNTVFGKDGVAALHNRDEAFLEEQIRLAAKRQMIPGDMLATLEGMSMSSDSRNAVFGLDGLAALQRVAPERVDTMTSTRLANDLEVWKSLREKIPAEEILKRLGVRQTPQERQAYNQLYDRAEEIMEEFDFQQIYNQVDSLGTFGNVRGPGLPIHNLEFENDYEEIFKNQYALTGDEEAAKAATQRLMQKVWGATDLGGRRYLMKYPPERVGYPTISNSYRYIDIQVQEILQELAPHQRFEYRDGSLKPPTAVPLPQTYQLISDDQTREGFEKWKQTGADGDRPSYQIIRQDPSSGVLELMQHPETGEPVRVNFDVPMDEYLDAIGAQNRDEAMRDAAIRFGEVKRAARLRGEPVPEWAVKEYNEAVQGYRALGGELEEFGPEAENADSQ